jgi:Leucine-rich repeat (LRR) protein
VLDLTGNQLSELPDAGRMQKLRILFCSENNFTELPEVLGAALRSPWWASRPTVSRPSRPPPCPPDCAG